MRISGDQLELGQRMIKVAYKIGEKSASDDDQALNASSKFCKERERETDKILLENGQSLWKSRERRRKAGKMMRKGGGMRMRGDCISPMGEKKEEGEATRIHSTEGNVTWMILVRSEKMKEAAPFVAR